MNDHKDQEHLFIGDLRKHPGHDAEVRLYVGGKLKSGTWPYQVVRSIDDMIREAQAQAWEQGRATGMSRAMRYMSDEPNLDPSSGSNPYTGSIA